MTERKHTKGKSGMDCSVLDMGNKLMFASVPYISEIPSTGTSISYRV
jgi:hypothetical protein